MDTSQEPKIPAPVAKGFIPGPKGIIPLDKKLQKKVLRAKKRVRLNALRLQQAQGMRLLLEPGVSTSPTGKRRVSRPLFEVTGGFPPERRNRKQRRINFRKRPVGEYSRGDFLDAYGEKLDRNVPGEMQFAVSYFHPCKGKRPYVRKARPV